MTTRAPKGLCLFREAADRRRYLELLAKEVIERAWSLRTYCLMGNHVHLLVMTPEADLQWGMKAVHERFAQHVHRRYEGHGHVFGGRFKNRLVRTPEHEAACLRYIALNPVKAGLCAGAADWEWSAHRALSGDVVAPDFLDVAGAFRAVTKTGYRQLVAVPDASLLADLASTHPQTWLVRAVEEHGMSIAEIAACVGVGASGLYKRLAKARAAAR